MIGKIGFLRGSILAAILLSGASVPALAAPVKNIVLVHGAWVDGSGWKAVYEILTKDGYEVTLVQAPLTVAAWRSKPSWAIVAAADKIINPDLERWYYARAHSHTTVIGGASHSVYESRPKEVAAVIEDAAQHASP